MQVNKNNISQFLTAKNVVFMIPVYQRNYDWDDENCKDLWNDIWYLTLPENQNKTHFLGTICTKSVNSREKSVIDGQQRITTLTLLMKAMHDCVEDDSFKSDIEESFLKNTGYGVPEQHKVKLHLNKRDDAIYNKLLESNSLVKEDELAIEESESRIYKNYRYFCNCFNGLTEQQIADLTIALERITIVDLDVENENPQEIFESLNSTGVALTDVDLLRNFLLMSLDHETQQRLYENYWYKIEQNVIPDNMVRFFIDYLIYVKKTDAITIKGRRQHITEGNLYISFKLYYYDVAGTPQKRYESSKEATEKVLQSMYECSKLYRYLVFGDTDDIDAFDDIRQIIFSIVELNEAKAARPLLMYVIDKLQSNTIQKSQAVEMLNAVLSFVVRAKICEGYGSINGQTAGNVLLRLSKVKKDDVVNQFWIALTMGKGSFAFPTDETFRENLLNRQIFDIIRSKGVKYILYTLEQNNRFSKGLPRYDDKNTTIEHIMPKKLSDSWEMDLGDEVQLHDDYIGKLGNLALTSNNSEMSNKSFNEKREWYRGSSFSYTRYLADKTHWGIDEIRNRSKMLADKCIEIWALPPEYQMSVAVVNKPKRRPPFKFSMVGIRPRDELVYTEDISKVATVINDDEVEYGGAKWTISSLAQKLLKRDTVPHGTKYFMYKGETLSEMRDRIEGYNKKK